jgi:SAM-dependent methyltransferase
VNTSSEVYEHTRRAWREIWIGTEFDLELQSLNYERFQEILKLYIPRLDRNAPILEAGCGPAHVVYYLRQQGFQTIGVDYAPEALQHTHNRFPDLPLHMGDVHALPYPSNYFGGYLSFGVVEHFEHGPEPALIEALRVLRPNGTLVITVPHPQLTESIYQALNRLLPGRQKKLGPRAGYYERTYTHHELAKHVESAGFRIDLVTPVSHSYTFYGLHSIFRKRGGYYETNSLASAAALISRRILPWKTAFGTLILAHKSN